MTEALKNVADTAEDLYALEQWVADAHRRRDEVRSGCVKTISATEVFRRIEQLLAA